MTRTAKITALVAASGLAVAAAALLLPASGEAPAPPAAQTAPEGAPVMHVMKSPTCGCCAAWIEMARERGYRVEVEDTRDHVGMKQAASVPQGLWACHTARIGGYTVEGHVPFEAVRKLLEERPDVAGISVPGMPAGSPGMGTDPEAVYDVIAYGGTAGAGTMFYRAGR